MLFNTYIGWDIGGAHLKMAAVDAQGSVNFARQLATPMWEGLECLTIAMNKLRDLIPDNSVMHVVTMTAELADYFKDRRTGVETLIDFLDKHFEGEEFHLYAGNHGLIKTEDIKSRAKDSVIDIASANWHATASFVAQHIDNAVLIDIGSTTTDIIPISSGKLVNTAYSDYARLRQYELVYTGIIRTPVMAVVNQIFCDNQWQNIAAEKFSTMADVYRLTAELNEHDDMMMTADGAGKTSVDSARRLARMVGLDLGDEDTIQHIVDMAEMVADAQLDKINDALLKILFRIDTHGHHCLVGAGAGRFLVRKLAVKNKINYVDFSSLLKFPKADVQSVLSCAAAVSVAQLARMSCDV